MKGEVYRFISTKQATPLEENRARIPNGLPVILPLQSEPHLRFTVKRRANNLDANHAGKWSPRRVNCGGGKPVRTKVAAARNDNNYRVIVSKAGQGKKTLKLDHGYIRNRSPKVGDISGSYTVLVGNQDVDFRCRSIDRIGGDEKVGDDGTYSPAIEEGLQIGAGVTNGFRRVGVVITSTGKIVVDDCIPANTGRTGHPRFDRQLPHVTSNFRFSRSNHFFNGKLKNIAHAVTVTVRVPVTEPMAAVICVVPALMPWTYPLP